MEALAASKARDGTRHDRPYTSPVGMFKLGSNILQMIKQSMNVRFVIG